MLFLAKANVSFKTTIYQQNCNLFLQVVSSQTSSKQHNNQSAAQPQYDRACYRACFRVRFWAHLRSDQSFWTIRSFWSCIWANWPNWWSSPIWRNDQHRGWYWLLFRKLWFPQRNYQWIDQSEPQKNAREHSWQVFHQKCQLWTCRGNIGYSSGAKPH